MKIAFVGISQRSPSHLWMRRMRRLLGDQIVVNIDDLRNTPRDAVLADDTQYIPRKMSRVMRAIRAVRLTGMTSDRLRSDWMLQTISQSNSSLVFVHFLNFAAEFNEVWQRLGIPVVVHCHGYDVTWDAVHRIKRRPLHPDGYRDRVRAMPDNVWFIANSTHTERKLREVNINPSKIFVKRFGVPLSKKPKSLSDRERPQILFLGRLIDCKGPLETARAFGRIANNHPGTTLDIAGGGERDSDIDDLIQELNLGSQIKCHGPVPQDRGRELRRQAAIFTAHNQKDTITQQEEAFGVSLLEAMGEGIPVVTGRSGGIPDFIRHQENGLLFQPGDIDAHASMLDDLLSSQRRRESLGLAAWETVRDSYQSHHELADMHRIFSQVSTLVSCPTLSELTDNQPLPRRAA